MSRTIFDRIKNITWYNIVPQSQLVLEELANNISDNEDGSSGGGGEIPTLQQVTDEGSITTNTIGITGEGNDFLNLNGDSVEVFNSLLLANSSLKYNELRMNNNAGEYTIYTKLGITHRVAPFNYNLTFPLSSGVFATEEWVTANTSLTTTVDISSAQLLAITTTPIELISAQGAGTYIVFDNIVSVYAAGVEAYDYDSTLTFVGIDFLEGTGAVDLMGAGQSFVIRNGMNTSSQENTAITLQYSGTAPTTGDGTLRLIITYRVITI